MAKLPLQSKKPNSLPLLAFMTIFLMLINRVHSSDSLSFTFNSFRPDQRDLILQGHAQLPSTNTLQLTGPSRKGSVGRALYSAPVRLWDKSTGKVASFETTFAFFLRTQVSQPADGIAFFITTPDTTIPSGSSGGLLGLFSPQNALNTSANQLVAVEFDTFFDGNSWDPRYRHIGIDVNSIRSSAVVRWVRREGVVSTVNIKYNPASGNLSVVSSYPNSQGYTVSYVIDLKTVLPEWVRIGFSAATGDETQSHNVLSWSFSSTLESNKAKEEDKYNIVRYV